MQNRYTVIGETQLLSDSEFHVRQSSATDSIIKNVTIIYNIIASISAGMVSLTSEYN